MVLPSCPQKSGTLTTQVQAPAACTCLVINSHLHALSQLHMAGHIRQPNSCCASIPPSPAPACTAPAAAHLSPPGCQASSAFCIARNSCFIATTTGCIAT